MGVLKDNQKPNHHLGGSNLAKDEPPIYVLLVASCSLRGMPLLRAKSTPGVDPDQRDAWLDSPADRFPDQTPKSRKRFGCGLCSSTPVEG